ncbi:MAG: family 10 glycosylhydrolase [Candidatus Gastranaerophilales bacterium]|nr:family 10 glycosylhydrolase [Candidatus Gastranaerophilales bacterium]
MGILVSLFFLCQSCVFADTIHTITNADINDKLHPIKNENPQITYSYKTQEIPANMFNERVLNFALNPQNAFRTRPDGIIYQESQISVDSINPKRQGAETASYYPGLRGPNQLIVYTPAYGLRTGTNEYGTEAIVENNMVVRLNGADSVIPKNGFVISGHGKAKTWILKNIQVGSKVYIDYSLNTINVFLTPESLIYAANEKVKEVSGIIDYYKQSDSFYDSKKADSCIDDSKQSLKKAERKPEKTQSYINDAMSSLDDAIKNAIPYNNVELKGVWVRPVETDENQIEKTVERIYKAGITDIFLETYFHGKTIYPSDYLRKQGVIYQRKEFEGFDPLAVWIKEAHKRNMKLHIWFESFYVGNDNPKTTPNHVLSVYPLWANKRFMNYDSLEPVPSLSEHNGYFLDPANPQVRDYILNILNEIIENYKPDGINLDYIRYPQTVDSSYSNYSVTNWGYTNYARNEFKSIYGIDPIDIKYGTGDWELWAEYRQNKISEFVFEVQKMTKPNNILLTAVIFPDLRKCKVTKMQNWKTWSINKYVDGFTPLILTGDKNTANILLTDVVKNTASWTKIYPGLFVTFMGGPFEDLLLQIQKTREFKTMGSIIFDYAHLDDIYIDALKTRVFNSSYDSKETQYKKTSENYKPELRIQDKKSKKKKRRNNNDND